MKLNTTTEKAIAVMALLSVQSEHTALTSSEIAIKLNLSDTYTKKILRKLVVAEVISAVSGKYGGFTLAKSTSEISVLMIIEAVEGRINTFPTHGVLEDFFGEYSSEAKQGDMLLKSIVSKADAAWCKELKNITVQDILNDLFADGNPNPNGNENWSKDE